SSSALTVSYTIGGSATNGVDYALISGNITIPANAPSMTLTIAPLADNIVEPAETVIVTLAGTPNYTIGNSASDTVTIADSPAVIVVAATDPNASETGPDPGTITITRSGGDLSSALQVFFTVSGSATEGTDYNPIGTSVTIPASQLST